MKRRAGLALVVAALVVAGAFVSSAEAKPVQLSSSAITFYTAVS